MFSEYSERVKSANSTVIHKSNAFLQNRLSTQSTLKSIFQPVHQVRNMSVRHEMKVLVGKDFRHPSQYFRKASIIPLEVFGDFDSEGFSECPLTPNGSWAHIPRDWLHMMTAIMDVINDAILRNDITVLHKLQVSQQQFFQELVDYIPLRLAKNQTKECAEAYVKKIIAFSNCSRHYGDENVSTSESYVNPEGWYIPNTSASYSSAEIFQRQTFHELLEFMKMLPQKTMNTMKRSMNTSKDDMSTFDEEEESISLKINLLISNTAGLQQEENFQKLLETKFEYDVPIAVEERETDGYDDSDYEEFNEKFIKVSEDDVVSLNVPELDHPAFSSAETQKHDKTIFIINKKKVRPKGTVKVAKTVKSNDEKSKINSTKKSNIFSHKPRLRPGTPGEKKSKINSKSRVRNKKPIKENQSDNSDTIQVKDEENETKKATEEVLHVVKVIRKKRKSSKKTKKVKSTMTVNHENALKKDKTKTEIQTAVRRKKPKITKVIKKATIKKGRTERDKTKKDRRKKHVMVEKKIECNLPTSTKLEVEVKNDKMIPFRRALTTQKDCMPLLMRSFGRIIPIEKGFISRKPKNIRYQIKVKSAEVKSEKNNETKTVPFHASTKKEKYLYLYYPKLVPPSTIVQPLKMALSKLNINAVNENLMNSFCRRKKKSIPPKMENLISQEKDVTIIN